MNILLRRTSALAAATLVAGALTLPAAAHAATTAKRDPRLASGAAWLSAELSAGKWGSTYGTDFYPDMGAVIDAGYAALRAGRPAIAAKAANILAVPANADSYVAAAPDHFAGPTAKALAFQQETGRSTTLASHHLLTDLESLVSATGRIKDTSVAYGDYANTIGQAFAAQALHRADSNKAASVTRFLLTQQCKAGWFRLYFTDVTPASTSPDDFPPHAQSDGACDADAKATPDTDVTAYAILNLLDQRSTPAVKAAIAKAVAWLKSDQQADGSFGGGVATEAPNSDSTGLAGWALGAAGATKAAAKAATWVYRHQLHRGPDAGAIAYDDTALKAVTSTGIDDTVIGQWRLATAQALPALAYLPGAKVSAKTAASAHRGTVTLKITVGGKRFAGKVAVEIGRRTLHAKAVHGVAELASAKVFRGKKKVHATVSYRGSAAIAPFSDRLTLKAKTH